MKFIISILLILSFCNLSAQVLPTPTTGLQTDQPVTLGMRFTPKANGQVTGVMYYRNFPGTVTGQLWTATGTLLASTTFSDNTAGWKSALFTNPVNVVTGTEYIISYFESAGQYYTSYGFFPKSFPNYDAPASAYNYGNAVSFPALSFPGSNYFVEPIFKTVAACPPTYIYIRDTIRIYQDVTVEKWKTDTLWLKDTLAYERNAMFSDSALNRLQFDDAIYNFEFTIGAKKLRFIRQYMWVREEEVNGIWIKR